MPNQVLPFDQALATVLAHAAALPAATATETLPLLETLGRTLANPVLADRDQPPFDRSTRDGYAVRSSDLPSTLTLIGQIRAGESWQGAPLAAGEAIEIMTGAPVPADADAVLMVEHATLTGDTLQPARTLRPGENIVPRAAEARAGQTVLPRGRRITAAEIAVAASCGCETLPVFALPKVAIVATGDELVELNESPAADQIRNSNTYALAALVRETDSIPLRLPIARDTSESLRARLTEARAADLILFSGGVSMGKYDLVEQVLTDCGAEFFFTGALIQPGKPIVFGRIPSTAPALEGRHPERSEGSPHSARSRNLSGAPHLGSEMWEPHAAAAPAYTYFFGLPGNPISTQVCFHLFVAPWLRALSGRIDLAPHFVEATLAEDIPGGAKVTRFLPAELTSTYNHTELRLTGWQGSGDLAANARGNCYCVLPIGPERFLAGETVRVLLR